MSVVMEHMIALKHVQTLQEVICVNVILDFYWRLMGLHAMVCAHIQMSIHACNYKYIFCSFLYTCFLQILMSVVTEQMVAPKYV